VRGKVEFHKNLPNVHAERGCIEYGPTVDVKTDIKDMLLGPPMPLWRTCLAMAKHWANPKNQLLFYLKLLGQPVNTMTLYMGA